MKQPKHKYEFLTFNGRFKVKIDGVLFLTWNQLDFKGLWAYKDDFCLYGIDIYLMNDLGGKHTIEVHFKTKQVWLEVLELLDKNL